MLGELQTASKEKRLLIRREVRRLKRELKATWKDWVAITKFTAQRYPLARVHTSY